MTWSRPTLRRKSGEPPNEGVSAHLLDGYSLSQQEMFLRCNFPIPKKGPEYFDVVVPGKADRRVDLRKLATFREVEIDMVLECAGNGRTLMEPVPEGTAWGLDAASPISVAGYHLHEVLGELPASMKSVVFTGADGGVVPLDGDVNYQFAITPELATSPGPVLATHINGEPLTIEHGAPVRLVVPGHYGMKSVKWLTRIEAINYEFKGYFNRRYRYYKSKDRPEGQPVGQIAVRSIISSPTETETVPSGPVDIRGSAWTGTGDISVVEVSANNGDTWVSADLVRHATGGRFAPVRWAATLDLKPGDVTILSRATDSTGATQPLDSTWNANGFANNVVQRLGIEVV